MLFSLSGMNQLEDLNTNRITRILTTDFPQYFAIVSRIRQEVHAIGPEGETFCGIESPCSMVARPNHLVKSLKTSVADA